MTTSETPAKRRLTRGVLAAGAISGLALSLLVPTGPAAAAIPEFPNNVVVFPDRDFITVEGYADHVGETALVEVLRSGQVMGSAKGVVSGGDVAFEVNHPGGYCWGAGTGVDVTPDIRPGDVVKVTFPDGAHDETTTSSAMVTQDMVRNGTTVTVTGTITNDVNPAQMETRVINPDLVALIGKRDVRALPGPLTPAPKGGYSSGMEFTGNQFTSTFVFDSLAAAETMAAADLGERAMSWQLQDADGNRQGLTIAEFGEAGGPGMGGCPAGPAGQEAPAGQATAVRSTDKTSAVIRWTPVAPQPGAAAVTGYSVEAISDNGAVTGVRLGTGANNTTITGLDASKAYTYEVRSMTGVKLSVPFVMGGAATDTTAPTLTLNPPAGATPVQTDSIAIQSNGQVFYTTDGSPAITGDMPSDHAVFYTGPIPVTSPITLSVAAFDQVGNHTEASGSYAPKPAIQPPSAPTGLAATKTQTSVALSWGASNDPSVTGYQVRVYDATGTALATQPPVTSVPRQTITGLTPNTTYLFGVKAINAGGSSNESSRLQVKTDAQTDRVTIGTAKWKAGDFRVTGTGSQVGVTISVYRVVNGAPVGASIAIGTVVAAAPPGVGDYDIRARNGAAPATNPGQILVRSSAGGVSQVFTVG